MAPNGRGGGASSPKLNPACLVSTGSIDRTGTAMASTAIAPAHDAAPVSPAALPCLVATVAYVVILIVGGNLLNDADSYWHLAVGQWIVDNGFPHADPFSFTFAGHPWIAKEWLSQVLYYGAWHLAGWPGVVLLAAAAIATSFGLLARFLEDRLAPATALVFVAAAFMLVAPHALARPHALAMPVMIGWMGGLLYASEQKKAPSYWLLPLMVAWANLHGGFVFGIFMVSAFGLDAVAAAAPADRWRTAGAWVRFAILALIAACITPYGPESFLAAFRVLDLGSALNFIDEWRPADFSHLAGLEIALLLGTGFALWRGFTLPWPRIVILIGLIHMALSAERNAELLGLIAPLLIAAPLARQVPAVAAGAQLPRLADTLAGVALALLIPLQRRLRHARQLRPVGEHHADRRGRCADGGQRQARLQRLHLRWLSGFTRHPDLHRRPHRAFRRQIRRPLCRGCFARRPQLLHQDARHLRHRRDAAATRHARGRAARHAARLAAPLRRRHRGRPRPHAAAPDPAVTPLRG